MTAITLTLEVIAKPPINTYLAYVKECLKHKIAIDRPAMDSFLTWIRTFRSHSKISQASWANVTTDTYSNTALKEIVEEIESKFIPGVVIQTCYTQCEYYPKLHTTSIYDTLASIKLPNWADRLELKLTYALLPPKVKVEIPEAIPNIKEYDKTSVFDPTPKEEPTEDNPFAPLPPDHPGFRHL